MALRDLLDGLEKATGRYDRDVFSAKRLNYTLLDVQELVFTLQAENFDKANLGRYLSVLINTKMTEKTSFELTVPYEIHRLASRFSKGKFTINGNAGNDLACEMTGGEIIVNGSAGKHAGYIEGGVLTINGDADDFLGYFMNGGEITVNGNARNYAGWNISHGSLRVNGNTGHHPAWAMRGISFIINGNTGKNLGVNMESGLVIARNIENLSPLFKSGTVISQNIITGLEEIIFSSRKLDEFFSEDLLKIPLIVKARDKLFSKEFLEKNKALFI